MLGAGGLARGFFLLFLSPITSARGIFGLVWWKKAPPPLRHVALLSSPILPLDGRTRPFCVDGNKVEAGRKTRMGLDVVSWEISSGQMRRTAEKGRVLEDLDGERELGRKGGGWIEKDSCIETV